jgi:hypothetical protein
MVSWILRKPLPLLFDPFECVSLFFSGLALPFSIMDCALTRCWLIHSSDHNLRRKRWEIKLAGRDYPHMYVYQVIDIRHAILPCSGAHGSTSQGAIILRPVLSPRFFDSVDTRKYPARAWYM